MRSHTNLILAQKPEVETLTKQISSPLAKQQQALLTIYDSYYQKAIRTGNFYRIVTGIILILVLVLINYLIVKRIMEINPKLKSYQKIIGQIIDQVIAINNNEANAYDMRIINVEQDDLNQLSEEIEIIAHALQEKEQQLQAKQEQEIREEFLSREVTVSSHNKESFSFLTVRLLLITKNRKKILRPDMYESLEEVLSKKLGQSESQLIEFQGEMDRVQIIFSYPPHTQLSKLVTALKIVSRDLIGRNLAKELNYEQNHDEIWSDAYFIASCSGLNSNIGDQLSINA
ncbi:IS200/IS605 family transposase [Xenococcus sp. PCC 7305]|uniref:IS200/IS605 family transposase n=1 Tax=Xenococcus sp. PCC 7305 TaxID=102125 RepID=UPI00351070C1